MCPQDMNRCDNSISTALYNESRVFLYRQLRLTASVLQMLEGLGWLRSLSVSLHQTPMPSGPLKVRAKKSY